MANIKEIADALVGPSPQEEELLRHAQEFQDVLTVKPVVAPPPSETKWWRRFEKRKKHC